MQLFALVWVFNWVHDEFSHLLHFLEGCHHLVLKKAEYNEYAECSCQNGDKVYGDPVVVYYVLINILCYEVGVHFQVGHGGYYIGENKINFL